LTTNISVPRISSYAELVAARVNFFLTNLTGPRRNLAGISATPTHGALLWFGSMIRGCCGSPFFVGPQLMHDVVLPLMLFLACLVGLAVALLVLGNLFGPRRDGPVKRMPYESGMDPIHDTRRRFDVRYYLVAIAFLVFDVELLFLYPWAVVFGEGAGQTVEAAAGRPPLIFAGGMVFLVLLVVGFVYDWRKGVFRWR